MGTAKLVLSFFICWIFGAHPLIAASADPLNIATATPTATTTATITITATTTATTTTTTAPTQVETPAAAPLGSEMPLRMNFVQKTNPDLNHSVQDKNPPLDGTGEAHINLGRGTVFLSQRKEKETGVNSTDWYLLTINYVSALKSNHEQEVILDDRWKRQVALRSSDCTNELVLLSQAAETFSKAVLFDENNTKVSGAVYVDHLWDHMSFEKGRKFLIDSLGAGMTGEDTQVLAVHQTVTVTAAGIVTTTIGLDDDFIDTARDEGLRLFNPDQFSLKQDVDLRRAQPGDKFRVRVYPVLVSSKLRVGLDLKPNTSTSKSIFVYDTATCSPDQAITGNFVFRPHTAVGNPIIYDLVVDSKTHVRKSIHFGAGLLAGPLGLAPYPNSGPLQYTVDFSKVDKVDHLIPYGYFLFERERTREEDGHWDPWDLLNAGVGISGSPPGQNTNDDVLGQADLILTWRPLRNLGLGEFAPVDSLTVVWASPFKNNTLILGLSLDALDSLKSLLSPTNSSN